MGEKFYGQLKTSFLETARGRESIQQFVNLKEGLTLASPLSLNPAEFERTKRQLRNGDNLTIFNTIADGDIFWEGKLKTSAPTGNSFDALSAYKSFETLLEDRVFARMCQQALPATLEKTDGRIIHGNMYAYSEQGTASAPHLYDFSDQGYASLNEFEDGDILRVFSRVTDGQILWRGAMDIDDEPQATGRKVSTFKFGEGNHTETRHKEFVQSVRRHPAELFDRWQIIGFPAMIERNI